MFFLSPLIKGGGGIALMDHYPVGPRRRQVLASLLEGLSEKEIAARLQISRHTIHHHLKRLHKSYNVHSRSELVQLWVHVPQGLETQEVDEVRKDEP